MSRPVTTIRAAASSLLRDRRSMGLTILVLAVGITATLSVAGVAWEVLVRPLPYPQQERLVLVTGTRWQDGARVTVPMSYLDIDDLAAGNRTFSHLAASSDSRSFNTLIRDEAMHVDGEFVSAGYFAAFGGEPWAGRTFTAEENQRQRPARRAVLSHSLWSQRYGSHPPRGGERIEIDGHSFEIVGVMPPWFRGFSEDTDLWLPAGLAARMLAPPYVESRAFRWLSAIGRLKEGVAPAEATADLEAVAAALAREYADTNRSISVRVTPLDEAWFGDLRRPLMVLLVASLLLLLVTCATAANLMLARAERRSEVLAIRAALGASPRHLLTLQLCESGLVAMGAALLALPLTLLTVRLLVSRTPLVRFNFISVTPGPFLLTLTLVVAVAAGLLSASGPLVWLRRARLERLLVGGGLRFGRRRERRFQDGLLMAEILMAIWLLVGTGVLTDGVRRLQAVDLGFSAEHLLTLRLDVKGEGYREDAAFVSLVERVEERLGGLPGVRDVAAAGPTIPTDNWNGTHAHLEGEPVRQPGEERILLTHHVTAGYFPTLGVDPILGRTFEPADGASRALKVVLSEAAAGSFWPGEDPLGRRLRLGPLHLDPPWREVIGVVPDIRHAGLVDGNRPGPDGYLSLPQDPPRRPPVVNFLVRTDQAPGSGLRGSVRRAVETLAPRLPPYDVATMEERLARQAVPDRFLAGLFSLFTALVIGLTAAGVYGLVSLAVQRRLRELGIRSALGADGFGLARATVGALYARIGLAIAVGAATGAILLPNLLGRALLPEVPAPSPVVFAVSVLGACVVMVGVATLAALVPVVLAWRRPPAELLRD